MKITKKEKKDILKRKKSRAAVQYVLSQIAIKVMGNGFNFIPFPVWHTTLKWQLVLLCNTYNFFF